MCKELLIRFNLSLVLFLNVLHNVQSIFESIFVFASISVVSYATQSKCGIRLLCGRLLIAGTVLAHHD